MKRRKFLKLISFAPLFPIISRFVPTITNKKSKPDRPPTIKARITQEMIDDGGFIVPEPFETYLIEMVNGKDHYYFKG